MFKIYSDLTKFGIVIFVLLSGVAGYATSFAIEQTFHWLHFLTFIFGLYFLCSGSLALNQAQEWSLDRMMTRTAKRPIASGLLSVQGGLAIATILLSLGFLLLFKTSSEAAAVGLLSVVLYNGTYTYIWKKRWVFGAVPGAIPGALPVTIGYAANTANIFTSESIYLFMIMFLWQMPHFWVLAIKYKEDYAKGGFPVLPVILGDEKTIFQIGLYSFAYIGFALASPWFVHASWIYLGVVIPFSYFVMKSFYRYQTTKGEKWFPFFTWLNLSMLVFIAVPVIDKWNFLFTDSN